MGSPIDFVLEHINIMHKLISFLLDCNLSRMGMADGCDPAKIVSFFLGGMLLSIILIIIVDVTYSSFTHVQLRRDNEELKRLKERIVKLEERRQKLIEKLSNS